VLEIGPGSGHLLAAAREAGCSVEAVEPAGYRLGKLTPFGVEFYPWWDPELESFVEGNYVALTARAVAMVPAVSWWK